MPNTIPEDKKIKDEKITAPFTEEQVIGLNNWQKSIYHPFTCNRVHGGERSLIATSEGWKCPNCDYTQNWAHAYMVLDKPFTQEDMMKKYFPDFKK